MSTLMIFSYYFPSNPKVAIGLGFAHRMSWSNHWELVCTLFYNLVQMLKAVPATSFAKRKVKLNVSENGVLLSNVLKCVGD